MTSIFDRIEQNPKIAKVTLRSVIDRQGVAAEIFGALGEHGLNVELISTSSAGRGRADISFAVLEGDLSDVVKLLDTIKGNFGAQDVTVNKDLALITIYGSKLATTPGVAGKIFKVLSENGINIDMISASLTVLSLVVDKTKIAGAVDAIQKEFPG
jgi:aspartate kinase